MGKQNLDEISFIRPILIILLLLYHAFAPWCNAWGPFEGFEANVFYWWIARMAYSFMLPMFVFVSGYIWSYQRESLCIKDSLFKLSTKKFKRLLVPSLLFSFAYILIVDRHVIRESASWSKIVIDVLQGYAHMWFLPMLLWCFLIGWVILKMQNIYVRWLVIIGLFIASIKPLPYQLNESFYYIIYFMMGYEFYLHRDNFSKTIIVNTIVSSWILFILSFVFLTITIENLKENTETFHGLVKAASLVGCKILTYIYASIGLFAMYATSIFCTTTAELPKRIVHIGALCFGVYLFQQFILQILYYHTSLPNHVRSDILPWVGFSIALLTSSSLSYLCRLTKLGRQIF